VEALIAEDFGAADITAIPVEAVDQRLEALLAV
jgi:hypothetical protein